MKVKDLVAFKKMAEEEQLTNPTVLIAVGVGMLISLVLLVAHVSFVSAVLRRAAPNLSESVLALISLPNLLGVAACSFLPVVGIVISSLALRRRIDAEITARSGEASEIASPQSTSGS